MSKSKRIAFSLVKVERPYIQRHHVTCCRIIPPRWSADSFRRDASPAHSAGVENSPPTWQILSFNYIKRNIANEETNNIKVNQIIT